MLKNIEFCSLPSEGSDESKPTLASHWDLAVSDDTKLVGKINDAFFLSQYEVELWLLKWKHFLDLGILSL